MSEPDDFFTSPEYLASLKAFHDAFMASLITEEQEAILDAAMEEAGFIERVPLKEGEDPIVYFRQP